MKSQFLLLALIFFCANAFCQTKNTISVFYAPGSADVNTFGAIGDFGYESQSAKAFGLAYTKRISKHFSLESGFGFSKNNTKETSFPSGHVNTYYNRVDLITVPVLAKFNFLRYLYADIGLDIDFQTNYTGNSAQPPNQSGIGIEGDVGAKYSFGPVAVFISPYFQNHGIINYHKGSDFNMINTGVKFGLGYSF